MGICRKESFLWRLAEDAEYIAWLVLLVVVNGVLFFINEKTGLLDEIGLKAVNAPVKAVKNIVK